MVKDREVSPICFIRDFLVNIPAKFFEFETFKSKKVQISFCFLFHLRLPEVET